MGEPMLPPLPPQSNTKKRKRHRPDVELTYFPSSDPALFSSDDIVTDEREKKGSSGRQYQGTWWGDRDEQPERKEKRKFTRAQDSGVWLNSDDLSSDATDGVEELDDALLSRGRLPERKRRGGSVSRVKDRRWSPGALTSLQRAEEHVLHCLEIGREDVDLSHHDLDSLPEKAIMALGSLTKPPLAGDLLQPSQESYQPLTPSLRLFLSCNRLTRVPECLFRLECLAVLSLRANRLTVLPPAISQLKNLEELNVAQNQLAWLPFEFLTLFRPGSPFTSANIHPNPFLQPRTWFVGNERQRTEQVKSANNPDRLENWASVPQFEGQTSVTYFDANGSSVSSGISGQSQAPSLSELALRKCLASSNLPELENYLQQMKIESRPARALSKAREIGTEGYICAICRRRFHIARAMWYEKWHVTNGSPLLPDKNDHNVKIESFVVRAQGCSWACVPEGRNQASA